MRKKLNLKDLQVQSRRNNFQRRQGLMNYEIPIFKKVNNKDLRGIISKKLTKMGKFYEKFRRNQVPEHLLPQPQRPREGLVEKYWHWEAQANFMKQKHVAKLLANTSAESKESRAPPKPKTALQDPKFCGLPLVKSRLLFKNKGKVAKALKKRLEAVEQLRKEVSSDLELIQKETPVFAMNYEQAERGLATNLQHRHKRYASV